MACELFGYHRNELISMKLMDLIKLKKKDPQAITESHLEPSGEVVILQGKVVSILYLLFRPV